jgi:GNAT superfamily N-acetyltransferase
MGVVYSREASISVEDYVAAVGATTMAVKRPLDNRARIAEMIAGANFIVTAREADGRILGLARCITDFAWVAYCAELVVIESAQGRGIGQGILAECWRLLGPRIGFILISEPGAVGFYERAGLEPNDSAFYRPRTDRA